MIINDHPELAAGRAKLEAGRVITIWHGSPADNPRFAHSGAPFVEIVSGLEPHEEVHRIKPWPTAAEAIEAWLACAQKYAGDKPFLEWRIQPEIEERDGEWRIYSRFAAFREGQRPVWPDVLSTRDAPSEALK